MFRQRIATACACSIMMAASATSTNHDLPAYAHASEAFHRAFAAELKGLLGRLPLRTGDRVLDVACGDGAFSHWLSERTKTNVVALDLQCDWLKRADQNVGSAEQRDVTAVQASAAQIPFDNDRFDLVWCAQSFRSLADVPAVLREMVRVVRPGGVVAVLEDDALHQLQLPWPVELELAVRTAELEKWRQASSKHQGYYIGRRLVKILTEAGLTGVVDQAASFVRQAPLDDDARDFLASQLSAMERRVSGHLAAEAHDELHELLHAANDYWLDRREFSAVCEVRLAWGYKS